MDQLCHQEHKPQDKADRRAEKAEELRHPHPNLGVAGKAEHGGIKQAVPVVVGLACPALGLGVFNLLALGAKLRHNPAQKRGGVVQITQGLDKAFIVQAKPGKLLDHFHIAHLFDGFVVTIPQKVHDRVFLAGGLFPDYNFVAFFPFSHKLWNHLHRVLEVRADGNGAVPCGMDHTVIGAVELQNLAVTYNEIYVANKETEKLIRHEAEHDPLTDLLNRGSFNKLIHIYETGESPFALILVDVDVFKEVNDTFGHGIGDQILRKVASILKKQFRNIDYVCRIGGDEFAVIMVNSASDKRCTIQKKIEEANEELSNPTDSLPAVSLSVGVAFSDRKNPKGSISNDADAALYYIKEHGRHNCGFY